MHTGLWVLTHEHPGNSVRRTPSFVEFGGGGGWNLLRHSMMQKIESFKFSCLKILRRLGERPAAKQQFKGIHWLWNENMWVVWCRCLIREINNHGLSSSIYSHGLKLVCVLYLWWSFAALGHRSVVWCQQSLPTPGGWGGRGSVSTCPTRCGTTGGGRGTARSRSLTNANAEREREG